MKIRIFPFDSLDIFRKISGALCALLLVGLLVLPATAQINDEWNTRADRADKKASPATGADTAEERPDEPSPTDVARPPKRMAVFAALNKVTARISHLEVPIDTTVKFGALKITPRYCNVRPPTETPWTTAFVQVDEKKLSGEELRIFSGWMFAQSPGLHAVEHPVFDVWLTNCKIPSGAVSGGRDEKSPSNFNDDSSLFR